MRITGSKLIDIEDSGIIARQVNAFGIPENLFHKELGQKYPHHKTAYEELCSQRSPSALMGTVQILDITKDLILVNYFAKVAPTDKTSYDALVSCWKQIRDIELTPVYIQHGVGCFNDDAEWEIYSTIVDFYRPDVISCKPRP